MLDYSVGIISDCMILVLTVSYMYTQVLVSIILCMYCSTYKNVLIMRHVGGVSGWWVMQ